MNIDLIDAVQTVYPNAYPMSFGQLDPDSAVIEWGDCKIVVTSLDHDGYDVGIYDVGQWDHGCDPIGFASFPHDVAGITAMLDDLTDGSLDGPTNNHQWAEYAADEIHNHPDRLAEAVTS